MEPKSLFERAVEASRWLNRIEPERIDRVLLSVADAACYTAKTHGRNRTETKACETPRQPDPIPGQ